MGVGRVGARRRHQTRAVLVQHVLHHRDGLAGGVVGRVREERQYENKPTETENDRRGGEWDKIRCATSTEVEVNDLTISECQLIHVVHT